MDPRSEAIDLLGQTVRRLRRIYDLKAAAHGLTLSRVRVLRVLVERPGLSQLDLAQALHIEPPTLKRQLDALVAAGLVSRGPVAGGGRGKGHYLTDLARDSAYADFARRARAQILEGVSAEDLAAFGKVLRQIGANIEDLERE